ncbi:MAG: neuraminidase-like domain-containing protein, partial [Gammaproteobacteria bacterium]|nr:neuraminidase-like domain-containing protein [Gammaproteobacteria bacterium]
DDKSELFNVLADQLLQNEVRADTAQNALLEYCRGLHGIGNLEIAAIYEDDDKNTDDSSKTKELHVFSRTRAIPQIYYHSIRSENGIWSDWNEVKVDIAGNHLIPVKYNGRMYLFWPVFVEKLDLDNEVYKIELADAEVAINDAKTAIDKNKKLIDDLTNLISEFENAVPPQNAPAIAYVKLLGTVSDYDYIDQLDSDYSAALVAKENIIEKFSYLDTTLNWSEQLLTSGWSPKKVGESRLQTKVSSPDPSNPGDVQHLSNPGDVRLSIKSISPQLEIKLYSKRDPLAISLESEVTDLILYQEYGTFTLDICENRLVTSSDEIIFLEDAYFVEDETSSATTDIRINQKWLVSENSGALHFIPEPNQRVELIYNLLTGSKYCSISPLEGEAKDLSVFSYEDTARVFIVDRSSQSNLQTMEQDEPFISQEPKPHGPASWDNAGSQNSLWAESTQLTSQVKESTVYDSYGPTAVSRDDVKRATAAFSSSTYEKIPAESLTDWDEDTPLIIQSIAADTLYSSEIKYTFTALYHPHTCTYIRQLSHYGIDGLYLPDKELGGDSLDLYRQQANLQYFEAVYNPTDKVEKDDPELPVENIDFTNGAPYAVYNWELFYHAPMLIAKSLIQNQKFEDAQKWLPYVFNPTANDVNGSAGYWRVGPFWLEQIEINNGDYTTVEQLAQFYSADFDAQLAVWEDNTFNPFAISRLRTIAYMRNTVMTYLDNLLAWGDQLFRRDTIESINEAAQLYVLAVEILGPKPLQLPASSDFGQAVTALELMNGMTSATGASSASGGGRQQTGSVAFLGTLLTFCIPANDYLLAYWDTVADRLFKIRHCMNIEGVIRSLPLFEPPIDPALLVRAAASGLSIADAVSGLNAPRPHYRFTFMLQKALEFLGEVKNLGGALLSALGSQDAEELSQIRASHEVSMAKKILDVRKQQVEEIEYSLSGLNESLISAGIRRDHYQNLINTGNLAQEEEEQKKLESVHKFEIKSANSEAQGAEFHMLPNISIGIGSASVSFGGSNLGSAVSANARGWRIVASQLSFEAGKLSRQASNIRRSQEWGLQLYTAERDLEKLNKDILASEIRKAIAEREITNQETQIANSEEAELFLQGKFTNKELYSWMVTQLSTLYFQAYQLAQELASAAEQCYQYELGVDASEGSFIQFGHWD